MNPFRKRLTPDEVAYRNHLAYLRVRAQQDPTFDPRTPEEIARVSTLMAAFRLEQDKYDMAKKAGEVTPEQELANRYREVKVRMQTIRSKYPDEPNAFSLFSLGDQKEFKELRAESIQLERSAQQMFSKHKQQF